MGLHKSLGVGDIHIVYNWEYSDQVAREAANGFIENDIGKVARQIDNNSLWWLVSVSPVVWKDLGISSADGDVNGPNSSNSNAVVRFNGTTGKLIKNSKTIIDNAGNIDTPGKVNGRNIVNDGYKLDDISVGAINAEEHIELRQLIHFINEGPATTSFKEILPSNSAFPTSIIWWDSQLKERKIVEKTIIRGPNQFPIQIQWKSYSYENVVLETITDSYDYSDGNIFTPKIIRTIS